MFAATLEKPMTDPGFRCSLPVEHSFAVAVVRPLVRQLSFVHRDGDRDPASFFDVKLNRKGCVDVGEVALDSAF